MSDKDMRRTSAKKMSLDKLVEFANRLRTDGRTKFRDDGLDHFELFGALREAVDDVVTMLTLLRSLGQDDDADLILEGVALSRPAIETADIVARLEEQAERGEEPTPDTRTIAQLVTAHRTPRDLADFIHRLADKHENVVNDVLTTTAEHWRVRSLARMQLALIASGRVEIARSCVELTLARSGDEVYEFTEHQQNYGILDRSLMNKHLNAPMTVNNLTLFVLASEASGRVMEPESIMAEIVKRDQEPGRRNREFEDLPNLYWELHDRGTPALAGLVTTEVARRREPSELIRYIIKCDHDGEELPKELFEEVIKSRDGSTIGDSLQISSTRSEAVHKAVLSVVAEQTSAEALLSADRTLADAPELAISLLRAALHAKTERFTSFEVAQLFVAICRNHARSAKTSESRFSWIRPKQERLIGIARTMLRNLVDKFSTQPDSPVSAPYLAELSVEVAQAPDIPPRVSQEIRTDIADVIWSQDSRRLRIDFATELRRAGGEKLAAEFERRYGSHF